MSRTTTIGGTDTDAMRPGRRIVVALLLALLVLPLAGRTASANGAFSGRWEVIAVNEARALATLDLLHDERDTVTGAGETTAGVLGRFGGAAFEITRGEAADGGLGLRFSSQSAAATERFSGRIFLNPAPPGTDGTRFLGSMVIGNRAYNVEMRSLGRSTTAVAPHACTQLDRAAERITERGESADKRVRQLLAAAGLDIGGRESGERCAAALASLEALEGDLDLEMAAALAAAEAEAEATQVNEAADDDSDPAPAPKTGSLASLEAALKGWSTTLRDGTRALNVRSGPGLGNAPVGSLPGDAENIEIIGGGCDPEPTSADLTRLDAGARGEAVQGKWCNIRWTDGGGTALEGWVSGSYLVQS